MHFDDSLADKLLSVFVFVSVPLIVVTIIIATQAINSQCGTNYSQLDVMLSSKSLTELCRITNQQLTVNQK